MLPDFFRTERRFHHLFRRHRRGTVLISLDHDLPCVRSPDGLADDYGTGREVADYLATVGSVCPVVVHTANSPAGDGMMRVLKDAGWSASRVRPIDDLRWIDVDWSPAARELIRPRLVLA